ncbi:hypothetical protein PF006_g16523 [Phytophthora fragariae]|uniref:Reverse transcriptase domain-containing protein n=2 Tax=Phytophthora fragariae TaxID=53985 RepID=A0A6A3T4R0_9STRA|nr:hypothetical protein PF003_g40849 [Phytophthora fragariae]KAE9127359.1 hypothetical protein PF006_g16523 [Phytophthora fragariae]
MQGVVAGSAHVEKGAGVVARANKSGRVGTPTTQGVVAGSARVTEDARAGARATTSGRAGAPTFKDYKGDEVTSAPKAEASSRDADSAAEDKVPPVVDVFTGEPKVGEVLTPLPTVAELLELKELSYVEFMDSLKAGELAEVVLRPEGSSLDLNSSSVMDPEVLEDERTSKRQTRYGAAILKDPSDPYYALLKEFSDVVSDDPPSVLPPDRGVRHEIDLVPGTKYCTTRQWPLPKEQVDVIDAFFAAKHAAGMVRESKSPHSSPTFCVRKPNGKWRMVHAFNKLNAATIPASTPICGVAASQKSRGVGLAQTRRVLIAVASSNLPGCWSSVSSKYRPKSSQASELGGLSGRLFLVVGRQFSWACGVIGPAFPRRSRRACGVSWGLLRGVIGPTRGSCARLLSGQCGPSPR